MLHLLAKFELYKEADVWAAVQRVVRSPPSVASGNGLRIPPFYASQLQMVLEIYLPFDDEGSPLDGLTGLAFSTPG